MTGRRSTVRRLRRTCAGGSSAGRAAPVHSRRHRTAMRWPSPGGCSTNTSLTEYSDHDLDDSAGIPRSRRWRRDAPGRQADGAGLRRHRAGQTIITQPNNLETAFRDGTVQAPQLLTDLMLNFWTYGRAHWSWTASSTGAVADGGLVKGAANF